MSCATENIPNTAAFTGSQFSSAFCESALLDSGFSDQNQNHSLTTETRSLDAESISADSGVSQDDSVTVPESLEHLGHTERLMLMQKILDLFFNNRIKEAEAAVEPHKNECIHFSHAKMLFVSVASFLTLDPEMMENAKAEVKRHLDFIYPKRPNRGNFYRFFGREDYNMYSDEEMIAEMNYAEGLFVYSTLTFFHSQTIVSLIKAAFKLHTAHGMLQFCYDVNKHKTNWQEEHCRYTFEAGVLNGIGSTNLMLSNLPSSILKLLAIAGLSGERQLGLSLLKQVSKMKNQPRIQLTYIMILAYNIYLEQMLGSGDGGTEWASEIGSEFLSMYPNGAVPLMLNGRVSLLRSDPCRAMQLYDKCLQINTDWPQIDLFCYFDLVWCHAVTLDWENAAKCCTILRQKCTWGHAINMHIYASFKYMQNETVNDPAIKKEIATAMAQVEGLRKRYAGRTYPAEKLAIERSKKYFAQNGTCTLPAFELFYVWNVFSMLKRNPKLIQPIADMIEEKMSVGDEKRDLEDHCVLLLLRGVCAKHLKEYGKAIQSLTQVMELEDEACLKRSYVVPHSTIELGLVYIEMGDLEKGRYWVEKAKSCRSSKYLLEALVQLKVHSALRQIDELRADER